MSGNALSQDTFFNVTTPLSVIGSGGALVSTFSTLAVSTIDITGEAIITNLIAGSVSSMIGEFDLLVAKDTSTITLEASTISTLAITLDGNVLTTAKGGELLLNGIPIATTQNISSLQDWSYDPAVSTLNMNGNYIVDAIGYVGSGTVSTNIIEALSGTIGNLVCNDISTVTLTVLSTIHAISTVSSLQIVAEEAIFSSINGAQYVPYVPNADPVVNTLRATTSVSTPQLFVSTINGEQFTPNATLPDLVVSTLVASTSVSTPSLFVTNINGSAYPPPQPNIATWAQYSANATVNLNGNSLTSVPGMNIINDRGASLSGTAINMISKNGTGGTINILADSGYGNINGGAVNITANGGSLVGGLNGRVSLVANGGTAFGIGYGGTLELIANSALGLTDNATSKISITGGGVNIYAGFASPFASVFGYVFINATAGISLVAGGLTSGFQVPGTVYLYGLSGITLGSDVYATAFYPRYNGIDPPADISINGRTTPSGSAYVRLNDVTSIVMTNGSIANVAQLTGVSSINGVPYVSGGSSGVASLNTLTGPLNITSTDNSVTITSTIDTINLAVASGDYPENPSFSSLSLSTGGAVSFIGDAGILSGVSTINGVPYVSGGVSGVASLNTLTGPLNITSTDNSVTITSTIDTINLAVASGAYPESPSFSSLNLSTGGDVSFIGDAGVITGLSSINGFPYASGVSSLNGLNGGLNLKSTDGFVNITEVGNDIDLQLGYAVGSLNGCYGSVSLLQGAGIEITSTFTTITLTNTGAGSPDPSFSSLTLSTTGTIALNGTTGSEGQVIGIPVGGSYPEWITPGGGAYDPNPLYSTVTIGSGGNVSMTDKDGFVTTPNIYSLQGNDLLISGVVTDLVDTAKITLSQAGTITINDSANIEVPATNGTGLVIGAEAMTMDFPRDPLDAYGVGQIINLSTINGAPYVAGGSYPTDPTFSSLNISTGGSINFGNQGTLIGISSINGAVYPPPSASGVESLNTLTGALNITSTDSSVTITSTATTINLAVVGGSYPTNPTFQNVTTDTVLGVSTITFSPSFPVTEIKNIGNIYGTSASDLTISTVGGGSQIFIYGPASTRQNFGNDGIIEFNYNGTSRVLIDANANMGITNGSLQVSSITGVSSINGVSYISAVPYSLTGTKGGGVISNRTIGSGNPFPSNTWTIATTITFNLPAVLSPTDAVYYDGWTLYDFSANFNSYWGVSYFTNTFATPTDILGSTSNTANALTFTNIQQIYLPLNLIIPTTHLVGGGTVTLQIYCNPTSTNHYITIPPINNARIGIVID